MITRRHSLWLGAAAALTWPAAAHADMAKFPFRTTRNRAWTAVRIGSTDLPFMLDTSASTYGIDPAEAEKLGLVKVTSRGDAQGMLGRTNISFYRAPKMTVGGTVDERDVHLAGVLRVLPDDMKGVIPVTRFGVTSFDFDAREVTVSTRVETPTDGYERLEAVVEKRAETGVLRPVAGDVRPVIQAELNGRPVRLMLNSGNPQAVTMRADWVRAEGAWDAEPRFVPSSLVGPLGVARTRIVRGQKLKVGRIAFASPMVVLVDPQTADRDGRQHYDGFIGMELLRRMNFIYDPLKEHVWIKPSRAIADGYRYDRAGLQVDLVDERPQVVFVAPGGPADRAGLKPGDRITGWRGNDGYYGMLWALMGAPGSTVEVQIEREGKSELKPIVLQEWL